MNVPGRWLERPSAWRSMALQTWRPPDDPTVYGSMDVDVSALQDWLDATSRASGVRCTITHAVTRALALTLARHPEVNVMVRWRRLWQRRDVDVFLHVAMPGASGSSGADLSGAVMRQVDGKTVPAIAAELQQAAQDVRAKRDGAMARTRSLFSFLPGPIVWLALKATDFVTNTLNLRLPGLPPDPFGSALVTSVGMFGIPAGFAPLVPFTRTPVIVAVGQVREMPVVRDHQVVVRPMLTLSATMDHRVVDGYQAGLLAKDLLGFLEHPETMEG